jgi:deoxyribose-phosphate aldolase
MIYTEYYINSIDEKEIEIKTNIDNALKYKISGVLAPYGQTKFIRKTYPDLYLGCFIDYPLASGDPNRRSDLINDAIKLNINFISITIPFYYIVNRKYDKFRDEIKKNLELSISNNLQIRYMLEYRKFDHALLSKICEILIQGGVDIIYPSTGFFIDNIEDNLIACSYLNEKTGIKTIVNGNVWTQKQMSNILKMNPYGFSSSNVSNFELINN